MTTLFAAALQGLGLSQSEAAAHLDISPHNINAMSAGRRPVPAGVWRELHTLAASQDRAARAAADKARRVKDGATIELALARDNDEARALGWPSVGAQVAVFRRVWELLGPDAIIRLVPRGSTPATKAAIAARQSRN